MTLVSVTAYHSFSGEVEASNTPTIRRLTPSCRHQLRHIAPLALLPTYQTRRDVSRQRFLYPIGEGPCESVRDRDSQGASVQLRRRKYGQSRVRTQSTVQPWTPQVRFQVCPRTRTDARPD